jgi:CheY-like chemotaxis protein
MTDILLIEDDLEVQQMLCTWLNDQGHSVLLANNGREGIRKFSTCPIDLVITDIFMGEKDGIETIKEIHHLKPGIPIIAISGGFKNQPFDLLKIAKRLGATYVFPKPVPLQSLNRAIQDSLNWTSPA